ncbi:P-loop NTPase family protein [Microvirga lotononidis]|uniref:ATPase involved in DNA replication initiation n=1 Tax=Microvirga lotononidis TaxID=864069 RepID=I4YWZ3_9HYPH|nr:DnaA/Hda family protein [Microvirga lotononidis]EIM28485.1 ATPase involved in DNA replication initiation [Microvirga lotononidis]WQO27441.1 DnaA/Hda family protein [Microvirga lotononidis]
MREVPKQLAFDLPLDPRFGAEDFLVSPSNEQAYGLIESWPDWPDTILLLVGPRGSGKSHLASIWATNARAWTIDASGITQDKVPHLISNGALAIEDMDRGERDEAALFHLLNLARERKASLLITCETPPDRWSLRTPDLLSRLRLAPSVSLDAPDDALLKAVLVKLFVDRQLVVDTSVVDYIALRIERSLAKASELVALLDREALSRGRRVSRAIAAEILGAAQETDESE